MPIWYLDPVQPVAASDLYSGPTHPMREVTRSVAFDAGWNADRSQSARDLFDGLAPGWTEGRDTPERALPLADALDRGSVAGQTTLEAGAGTCLFTRELCTRFNLVVAMDLSREMLTNAVTSEAPLVNADASRLPFPDGVVDVVVLVNTLLFPTEVERCLSPEGAIVWVSSRAEGTPIHLSAEDVENAMSSTATGSWKGISSRAGAGSWCVLRRC